MTNVVALSHRVILKLTGTEVLPYLQRLITVDVGLLNDKALTYAFLLNAKGRIVEDIFLLNHKSNEGHREVLLECDRQNSDRFIKLLRRYILHKDVFIEPSKYNAYFIHHTDQHNEKPDPRVPTFGGRVFGRQTPDGEVRQLSFYHRRRYEFGIPEGCEVFDRVPVFCNADLMSGISRNKGCYVGQETTAISMNNEVRQRVLPFTCNGDVSGPLRKSTNKVVGNIIACDGQRGLAVVKLGAVLNFPVELNADGGGVTVFIPNWWPVNANKP